MGPHAMTTTYTYNFSDGSAVTVSYDETSSQTTNPPNGYAVTAISGTWQNVPIYAVNGQTGNYANDATGLSYYDNAIFPNFGPAGDGANSLGNLDGIDTAGLLFQLTDANGPLVQLQWDGSSANALEWTSVFVGGAPNGTGFETLSTFTACYAAGTRILTDHGPVAVEHLREGDRVVTLRRFGLSEVRWIGHRRIDLSRHPRRDAVAPIRVHANAFAPGRPHRDLLLSPDHAVFVEGSLIPIRHLVNGATIAQETPRSVAYFHIELDHHDVLLAEGMPAESYLDTGNRGAFVNGGVAIHAHPDFALRVWAAQSCAPLLTQGPSLDALRAALLIRATTLGHARSPDPALELRADGRALPAVMDGTRIVAELPANMRELRLKSRTMAPVWTEPGSIDHRTLGVAVRDIRLAGKPIAESAFHGGWHRKETGLRWTNGDARLRIDRPGRLEITLEPLLSYWDDAATKPDRRAAA
jgi:hypothetical protein